VWVRVKSLGGYQASQQADATTELSGSAVIDEYFDHRVSALAFKSTWIGHVSATRKH
jgi:hypothetical protein